MALKDKHGARLKPRPLRVAWRSDGQERALLRQGDGLAEAVTWLRVITFRGDDDTTLKLASAFAQAGPGDKREDDLSGELIKRAGIVSGWRACGDPDQIKVVAMRREREACAKARVGVEHWQCRLLAHVPLSAHVRGHIAPAHVQRHIRGHIGRWYAHISARIHARVHITRAHIVGRRWGILRWLTAVSQRAGGQRRTEQHQDGALHQH